MPHLIEKSQTVEQSGIGPLVVNDRPGGLGWEVCKRGTGQPEHSTQNTTKKTKGNYGPVQKGTIKGDHYGQPIERRDHRRLQKTRGGPFLKEGKGWLFGFS